MLQKPKFKPVITRIKLHPEQAVLSCTCYSTGKYETGCSSFSHQPQVCELNPKRLASSSCAVAAGSTST